ncbi:MAG: DUF1800 domain-containing protein [Microlunatus sp.]|nr:DUF1800 domain-containing protein [Microlunatus sp.]MDN5771174.1 DUF1800 domain-containing protein [Microlunatus sp.]
MAELSEPDAVRRLVDRFGFGAGGVRLADLQRDGFNAALDTLLDSTAADPGVQQTPAPKFDVVEGPARGKDKTRQRGQKGDLTPQQRAERRDYRRQLREQQVELTWWWLNRMVAAEHPTRERLTWFWHGHFATSVQKVKLASLMLSQNETFRSRAMGPFTALAGALIVDPALLIWLDGNDNTAQAPNENLAREFMELFALGHGHYTESDVKEAARALTGWRIQRQTGRVTLRPRRHDDGSKTVLGTTGDLGAESLVEVLLKQPASAEFVTGRLWFRLVSPTVPSAATRERVLTAYGSGRDVAATLRAIATSPDFRDPAGSLVKQPVEWLVGVSRALEVVPSVLADPVRRRLLVALRGMGQIPFRPPSVGGWPAGSAWLTTGAAAARLSAARVLAEAADLSAVKKTATRNRSEVIRRLLGVDAFTTRTTNAISQVVDRPADAVALAAVSPEFIVSR